MCRHYAVSFPATLQSSLMSYMTVSLDDKYSLHKGRAYMSGIEALVRLPILQHQRDLDNAYVEVIAASEEAFMRRDIDGAVANLDDDYVLYQIGEDGPRERMRGIDTVRTLLGGFFEANTTWVGSEVERLTLMDNILVQVEYDFFETEAGTQTIPTLVVFEHRDGNRWREWRFSPQQR